MADKNIGALPALASVNADSLFVAEQQGAAGKVTGAQIIAFATAAVQAAAETAAHPPQVNEETGVWQTWNTETGRYEDTAVRAEGPQGETITGIERTGGTGAAGTVDTYTVTTSGGKTYTFQVRNGADGQGVGDMLKSVYDPQGRATDVFQYIDDLVGDIGAVLDAINGTGAAAGGFGSGVKVMDIGSAGLDITTLDFSQYAAGDVILVVADMDGGA